MNSKIEVKVIFDNGLPSKNAVDDTAVNMEKALSLTGFGKYQYIIILISGAIFCCVGFQSGLNAYIIPSAECDLKMTSAEKGLLHALFIGGGLVSAFFWGLLADHVGRKKVLVWSLLSDGVVTILSTFSQTFPLFGAFRFINGFLIGGPGSVIATYLGEFLGSEYRASSLCAIGFFWTISWIILPAAAIGVIPITWVFQNDLFLYNSWRIFVAIFAVPTLLCGIILAVYFPESPKFLFSQGRESETLKVLAHIYKVTHGKAEEFPVKTILPEESENTNKSIMLNTVEKANKNSKVSMYYIFNEVWSQTTFLFSYPTISSTMLACSLFFSNMFGYYGLGLWLPEIFNRFQEHYKVSNVSVTVCEMTQNNEAKYSTQLSWPDNFTLNHTSPWEHESACLNAEINGSVFLNTFIIGASCLLGNVLSSVLVKKLGLKFLTIVSSLISGLSTMAIYFLRTPLQNLIVSCIFLTFAGSGNTIITSASVELFPTKVRAFAVCTAIFSGRLSAVASNLIVGYVLDINCQIPIFLMGAVFLCGAFLGFFLPKESNTKETSKKGKT